MAHAKVHCVIGSEGYDVVAHASKLLSRALHPVQEFSGGEHAVTMLVTDNQSEYVVRAFPKGDPAVGHEVDVLSRLTVLDDWVPRLVAYANDPDGTPLIVTTRVRGAHPSPSLDPSLMARQLGRALAVIHEQPGQGLRPAPAEPPEGLHPIQSAATREWRRLAAEDRVLTHYDFWCGNALWDGDVLTGVVDWSGARFAPRGLDLAWCRQDLVLLGSPSSADLLLDEYEEAAEQRIDTIRGWDIYAAAQAFTSVEHWAPNYHGIGRHELTPTMLRQRLDQWIRHLLADGQQGD
jgi:aminoglycoside phosphotransferase (APT) family kinase protein